MSKNAQSPKKKPLIGFVGQGYIGKNYADDFEARGFGVIRYALENGYEKNRDRIKECDIVFIAVPTPTTPKGFDDSIIRKVVKLVGLGKIVVVKSTILPGTAKSLQQENPGIIVLNSPEFLSEATAARDAAKPFSNIVGMSICDKRHKRAAEAVQAILPKAPFALICDSSEAEVIKYAHNGSGYFQIIFFNLVYDLAKESGLDWSKIETALLHDPMICNRYAKPIHKSGRGAGGNCFIKDIAAIANFYAKNLPKDKKGLRVFRSMEEKNRELLLESGKDIGLLNGVYGEKKK